MEFWRVAGRIGLKLRILVLRVTPSANDPSPEAAEGWRGACAAGGKAAAEARDVTARSGSLRRHCSPFCRLMLGVERASVFGRWLVLVAVAVLWRLSRKCRAGGWGWSG